LENDDQWNRIDAGSEWKAVMDRIDLMRTYVRVVERGSFSSVARELGLGQPAVSKQVAALEADLGAELIRRTSRRMALTDAGQGFYEAALRLLDDFDAAASQLGRGRARQAGWCGSPWRRCSATG
jgi:DNA-binding transcriptional LysR family regulator